MELWPPYLSQKYLETYLFSLSFKSMNWLCKAPLLEASVLIDAGSLLNARVSSIGRLWCYNFVTLHYITLPTSDDDADGISGHRHVPYIAPTIINDNFTWIHSLWFLCNRETLLKTINSSRVHTQLGQWVPCINNPVTKCKFSYITSSPVSVNTTSAPSATCRVVFCGVGHCSRAAAHTWAVMWARRVARCGLTQGLTAAWARGLVNDRHASAQGADQTRLGHWLQFVIISFLVNCALYLSHVGLGIQ